MAPAIATITSNQQETKVSFRDLHLDMHNPRLALDARTFANEDDLVATLYRDEDLQELILSIATSGWLDYEPLIVDEKSNIVYEGNRRLAALKIMDRPELQARVKVDLSRFSYNLPLTISAILVPSRSSARKYIGFKHINGPKKWDAMAKAKYAAEWLEDGGNIDDISRALGDNYNTVRRLVSGWNTYQQALDDGFDPTSTTRPRFYFSHLYTAITRASIREYLGLTQNADSEPQKNPVPSNHLGQLSQLMRWLYGQKDEAAVIVSQNPDLNPLADVIASPSALRVLMEGNRLDDAWDEIDSIKPKRIEESLVVSRRYAEQASSLLGYYVHQQGSLDLAEGLLKIARDIVTRMRAKRDEDLSE